MTNNQRDFLNKFADLCEQYGVGLGYTNEDDGIHLSVAGFE